METDNHSRFHQYPEVLDARQVAEILRIGYGKALHLIRFSGISYLKIGRTYRVSRTAFLDWLDRSGQHNVN